MISFEATKQDMVLIDAIVKRALKLAKANGMKKVNGIDLSMDVTACHANGNPLRLHDLLSTDDGNFGHDVFGIARYIDRKTGKLQDFFSPRFSKRD